MAVVSNDIKKFRIIVIGDSGVGKTALSYRFCNDKPVEITPEASISVDIKTRSINVFGERVKLEIWDTAGQERLFRATMCPAYFRRADGVVLVYDVSSPETFNNLDKWLEECDTHGASDKAYVLVGNKCDRTLAVRSIQGKRFAEEHNMPFFETSALSTNHCSNVETIFTMLALKLLQRKQDDRKVPTGFHVTEVNIPKDSSKSGCC